LLQFNKVIKFILINLLLSSSIFAEEYRLKWTAPGDDNFVEQAHEYDIRYSQDTITEANFYLATRLHTFPPSPPYTMEYMTVILPSGTWFVALKTADEFYNWAPISNVLRLSDEGIGPPSFVQWR
jgi:hypothetical protein